MCIYIYIYICICTYIHVPDKYVYLYVKIYVYVTFDRGMSYFSNDKDTLLFRHIIDLRIQGGEDS